MGNNTNGTATETQPIYSEIEFQLAIAKNCLRHFDFQSRAFLAASDLTWELLRRMHQHDLEMANAYFKDRQSVDMFLVADFQVVSGRRTTVRTINSQCVLGFSNLAIKKPRRSRSARIQPTTAGTGGAQ